MEIRAMSEKLQERILYGQAVHSLNAHKRKLDEENDLLIRLRLVSEWLGQTFHKKEQKAVEDAIAKIQELERALEQ